MTNNDILRRLRYALDISNVEMLALFGATHCTIEPDALIGLLKKDTEEGHLECSDTLLNSFLDGFILRKRGSREGGTGQATHSEQLNNNIILKKLRIALNLRDDDLITILKLAGVNVSKSELGALFRNRDHKNFKACGDQFLRNFLKGLTVLRRPSP